MIDKYSFTLFEVLVSLVILAVIISSVSSVFKQNDRYVNYKKLQNMENDYIETGTIQNSDNIKIVKY